MGVIAGLGTAAIVLRSHALSIMGRPFIDAARVAGAGRVRLAFRHLLPHLIPLAGVSMFTAVVGAVVAHGFAAWLSFADDVVNWGAMMFMGLSLLGGSLSGEIAWNVLLAGALAISLFSVRSISCLWGCEILRCHGATGRPFEASPVVPPLSATTDAGLHGQPAASDQFPTPLRVTELSLAVQGDEVRQSDQLLDHDPG